MPDETEMGRIIPLNKEMFIPAIISHFKAFRAALEGLCTVRHYGKNDYFLRQQVRARFFGFVVSGAFREFYTDKNGREYNKAFNFPGQFTGSYYDMHSDPIVIPGDGHQRGLAVIPDRSVRQLYPAESSYL